MWLTALAFLKRYKGLISGGLAIIGVAVTFTQMYDWVYKKGVNDTIVKMQSEQTNLLREQKLQIEKEFSERLSRQSFIHSQEIERIKNEKKIEEEVEGVIEYVDRIVEVPADCTEFSTDVISVLRKTTDIFDADGKL